MTKATYYESLLVPGFGILVGIIIFAMIRNCILNYRRRKEKHDTDIRRDTELTVPLLKSRGHKRMSSTVLPLHIAFDEAYLHPTVDDCMNSISWQNTIDIVVNGNSMTLTNPDPDMLLVTFLREYLGLSGTKVGCAEGGCGACTVVLCSTSSPDPSHGGAPFALNSCLRPLALCDGYSVTTVEGIGSIESGLSEEQTRLVASNGTQCGYCTPGWISAMYGMNTKARATGATLCAAGIQNSLDGNICRCTGYRPILKAFESFGHPAPPAHCTGSCATCSGCDHVHDIEDSSPPTAALKTFHINQKPPTYSISKFPRRPLYLVNHKSGKSWIRPVTMDQLLVVFRKYYPFLHSPPRPGKSSYQVLVPTVKLVSGNTSIGVSKYYNGTAPYNTPDISNIYIDVSNIPEMVSSMYDAKADILTVGGAVSISTFIELLNKYSGLTDATDIFGNTFATTAKHFLRVANTQVRNAASWAGNLMLFSRYRSFASDVVISLATAGAFLRLVDLNGVAYVMSIEQFINTPYETFVDSGYIIVSVSIANHINVAGVVSERADLFGKDLTEGTHLITEIFKVAQRSKNAHAYVNAGFQFAINLKNGTIPECVMARIVYGGVAPTIFFAKRTEAVLVGSVFSQNILMQALQALQYDLEDAFSMSSVNRKQLGTSSIQTYNENVMQTFLYRAMLRCYPASTIPATVSSALSPWEKSPSRGIEVFLPDESTAPVSLPVRKLEGKSQATGQAKYPSDESVGGGCASSFNIKGSRSGYHGAIVFATQCAVKLVSIDPSQALALDGVISFFSAVDIPGENTGGSDLKLFSNLGDIIGSIGEPVGVIIATTQAQADSAAAVVNVVYESVTGINPIIGIDQAVALESFFPIPETEYLTLLTTGDAEGAMSSASRVFEGHVSAGSQTHFYMETQTATARPLDGSFVEVVCGTQAQTLNQDSIARVLGIKKSQVNVICPRTGGGFGGKLTRGTIVAASAALAATKLSCPVKIFNSRTADMNITGGREGFSFDYEVGVTDSGQICSLIYEIYVDAGAASSDASGSTFMGMCWADNAYYIPNYKATAKLCRTNVPGKTSMRAPGVVQSCFATEVVVQRIATELGMDIQAVQQINFIQNGQLTIVGQPVQDCTLQLVWDKLLHRSRYDARLDAVNQFNAVNLWRKRGLSICPVKYGMGWAGYDSGVRLSVNKGDGSIVLTHNGCEIGQGINTKAAQTVAYQLGLPIDIIRVCFTSTDSVQNGGVTGGSGTSEVVCQAAINACSNLLVRLAPYMPDSRAKNPIFSSIEEWTMLLASLPYSVSLNVEGWYSPNSNPNEQFFQYFVYAAAVSEIELDVLSGEVHVQSTEIVYDCGQSLNPAIDIGQIEGAFVMGLGYFLQESIEFDELGNLLSSGTWEYKPPLASDIPSVFNVTLLANVPNQAGIMRSKAVGEPPYVIANSVYFATKSAIASARGDRSAMGYFELAAPSTIDIRQLACLLTPECLLMPN